MRYVKVPQPVTLVDLITKKSGDAVPFCQYAMFCWLDDKRWIQPKTNLVRLQKILPEFQKQPGEWMRFEDADWKILRDVVEAGERTYNPLVHVQLSSFDTVILNALSEDPEETHAN
jgi:hypothetical protein